MEWGWLRGRQEITATRPGKHTKSYWKWPLIVDFPIKNVVISHSYVKLPEAKAKDVAILAWFSSALCIRCVGLKQEFFSSFSV